MEGITYTMDIQICKPHSSANVFIKELIYLEARAYFSVHSGIHSELVSSPDPTRAEVGSGDGANSE